MSVDSVLLLAESRSRVVGLAIVVATVSVVSFEGSMS